VSKSITHHGRTKIDKERATTKTQVCAGPILKDKLRRYNRITFRTIKTIKIGMLVLQKDQGTDKKDERTSIPIRYRFGDLIGCHPKMDTNDRPP